MNDKKKSNISNMIIGVLLLTAGLIFLLNNFFDYLCVGNLWPLFLLFPVFIFTLIWINNRDRFYALLFPITVLIFYCLYFLWLNFTSWRNVETTWPNFLIGPAIGFFVIYLPKKEWGFLIPSAVLLLISGIFYSELIDVSSSVIAVLFIAGGLFLIIKSRLSKNTPSEKVNEKDQDLRPWYVVYSKLWNKTKKNPFQWRNEMETLGVHPYEIGRLKFFEYALGGGETAEYESNMLMVSGGMVDEWNGFFLYTFLYNITLLIFMKQPHLLSCIFN